MIPKDRSAPLLFDALPDLAKDTPFTPLAHVPTAVDACDALAPYFGRTGIFMKRDDLISPLYGGNKVRRYEFVLADAQKKGKKRIVTAGGVASTQVMATALFGRALGFDVTAVLFDQPVTQFAREAIVGFADADAKLMMGGGYVMTAWRLYRAYHESKDNYLILPGAAGPRANLGYVDAMLELAGQVEREEAPKPDVIILPTGSSGTLAALSLGAAWLGWDTEIIGVRITTALACNRLMINYVIKNTDQFLEKMDGRWKPQRKHVNYTLYGGALGPGYGYPTPEAVDGIERVRTLTGAPGEITYSGKALAALHAIANQPKYRSKTILLWNTLSTARPSPPKSARDRVPKSLRWVLEDEPVA